jgi:hypothetical protein
MINLKKNDKLIIIIAVAVVVVAGIGIAAYNPPEDNGGHTGGVGGSQTYDVTWETHTKTVSVDDEMYAGKSSPFSTEIAISHENIVKVTVEITWTDDSTYGIFRTKGADTLTAEVSFGTETWTSVYNGTTEFIKNINSIPYDTTIDADSELDALDKLAEEYGTDDSLTFTIDVSVKTGEKIFRPLKYLRDKGNSFDLTITYEYYDASLTEGGINDTGNGDNDFDDPEDIPAYLGILIQTGLTRW